MPVREKYIEILSKATKTVKEFNEDAPIKISLEYAEDILELLKDHEAAEPINSYGTFRCGNCRNIVGYNDSHGRGYQNNFCSKCGKAVKWE